MINYETVSIELSPDYIKAIEHMCQKMNISRQIYLKKCVENITFGGCFLPIDCCDAADNLLVNIEEMGLKPDKSPHEENLEWENRS